MWVRKKVSDEVSSNTRETHGIAAFVKEFTVKSLSKTPLTRTYNTFGTI